MTEALQTPGASGTLELMSTRHAGDAFDVERNRWTAPLDGLDAPSVIVERTRIDPVPQVNLMERPLHMAQAQFDAALRATFVPTESVCALLAAHVHRAQAFAAVRYEEPSAYLKSLHDPDASLALASTWCLTQSTEHRPHALYTADGCGLV